MKTTLSQYDLIIDADMRAVFRLISEIEQWPALFPHVREATAVRHDRWLIQVVWRWIPLTLTCEQRIVTEEHRLEQRYRTGLGVRITCRWTLGETVDRCTQIRLDAFVAGGPRLPRRLALRVVGNDLLERTLEMTRLLAESDRKAHEGIE